MAKTKLGYKQNLLEQIYIPKDESNYKCFYNSRPITKTCPIYKLLDTILNNKLKRELEGADGYKLNNSQIGFRAGLGCELNILKMTEVLRDMNRNKRQRKL